MAGTYSENQSEAVVGANLPDASPMRWLSAIWYKLGSTPAATTTGGYTPYSYIAAAAANQDSTVVKASAGTLGAVTVMSVIATLLYLKVYDKATGPTSADTPLLRIPIPASTTGAGVSLVLPSQGLAFAAGISFRITTGIADNSAAAATAGDCIVNLGYK